MRHLTIPAAATILLAATHPGYALAAPEGFPDPSQFTETTVEHIKRNTQATINSFAAFKTPDGLECQFVPHSAGCWGPSSDAIPGFPPDAPNQSGENMPCLVQAVSFGGRTNGTDAPEPGHFRIQSQCAGTASPILPAGQKVTLGTTVCLVGEARLTACTDGNHGFVIQPSDSWVF